MESKEYAWAWVTADRLLTDKPCELVYAHMAPSGATTTTILYDGVDTNGKEIVQLNAAVATNGDFKPPVPVYCERGLYIDIGTAVTGCFVMWRHL